jgi:hypothetical protein
MVQMHRTIRQRLMVGLALGAALLAGNGLRAQAQFAEAVINYNPGNLPSWLLSYTNPSAALGEPSRLTPGPFGGPVDPFNPPYLPEQLVAVGAGGWLTVQMAVPIVNLPGHPFGLDFLIFGNAGFVITNGDYTGGGITDGSLFGQLVGTSTVWVSPDNLTWYQLDPALAPPLDGLYPTDGAGDFRLPVNPALGSADFAGLGLAGIRALYAGSGGGTGFDLAWARDANGQPVSLDSARFVRVEVSGGHAEIDAFVAVPEPSALSLVGLAVAMALGWAWPRSQVRRKL